jgi:bacterioferritin-associated ferredoxin
VSSKKRVLRAKRSCKRSDTATAAILRPQVTVICRCEEVTEDEIRQVIRRGYTSLEEVKRILRCGMGHCQGRSCLVPIARILSQETGTPVSQMKFPRPRPPLKPLPLGLLGVSSK